VISKGLERIERNDRHLVVMLHVAQSVSKRMFG